MNITLDLNSSHTELQYLSCAVHINFIVLQLHFYVSKLIVGVTSGTKLILTVYEMQIKVS